MFASAEISLIPLNPKKSQEPPLSSQIRVKFQSHGRGNNSDGMLDRDQEAAAMIIDVDPSSISHNYNSAESANLSNVLGLGFDSLDSESDRDDAASNSLHLVDTIPDKHQAPSAARTSTFATVNNNHPCEKVVQYFSPLASPPYELDLDLKVTQHGPSLFAIPKMPPHHAQKLVLPPSPPSPPLRRLPDGCSEIPWIDDEDYASFWLPCSSTSPFDSRAGTDAKHSSLIKMRANLFSATCEPPSSSPSFRPLSPPASPRRRSLSLPEPAPPPPSTLAKAPSSAIRAKSRRSSSSSSLGSRSSSDKRNFSSATCSTMTPERGRRSEPGSSVERRSERRSPPRKNSSRVSIKSMPMSSIQYQPGFSSSSTSWPMSFERESYDSTSASDSMDCSNDEEEEEEDVIYDSRFIDLPSIRATSNQSTKKGYGNDYTPRRRPMQKLHSEQWRLFAIGTAKERRTGEGYWTDFAPSL